MKKPTGIKKIESITSVQALWLSQKFKEKRRSINLKQGELAKKLKINMNVVVDFEKRATIPGTYENVKAVVNYALTGEL